MVNIDKVGKEPFWVFNNKDDKTKALQEMKNHMMDKAALYNGNEENNANSSTL